MNVCLTRFDKMAALALFLPCLLARPWAGGPLCHLAVSDRDREDEPSNMLAAACGQRMPAATYTM